MEGPCIIGLENLAQRAAGLDRNRDRAALFGACIVVRDSGSIYYYFGVLLLSYQIIPAPTHIHTLGIIVSSELSILVHCVHSDILRVLTKVPWTTRTQAMN